MLFLLLVVVDSAVAAAAVVVGVGFVGSGWWLVDCWQVAGTAPGVNAPVAVAVAVAVSLSLSLAVAVAVAVAAVVGAFMFFASAHHQGGQTTTMTTRQ